MPKLLFLLSFFCLFSLPSFIDSFLPTTGRHHVAFRITPQQALFSSNGDDNYDAAMKSFQPVAFSDSDQNISIIQKSLVQIGLDFDSYRHAVNQDLMDSCLASPLERVPGCVATVYVRSVLIPIANSTLATDYRVWLDGTADAMLSRGLLAVLSKALAGGHGGEMNPALSIKVTANDVLNIDAESVSDMLGLRHVLSKGRNDGLASMTRVVQNQIATLLGKGDTVVNSKESIKQEDATIATPQKRAPTVAMLLSGGVDSSVALNLLLQQGYNVTAFYLKIWLEDELAHLGQCPWENDFRACQAVCHHAGNVPLETVSLQDEYKQQVISYTVHEARRGRTPNPDIMCNSRVKFGCFYKAIEGRGFDYVASGHYAQLVEDPNTELRKLLRAPDPVKDQSYFLCALTQDQLKRVLFPIGHLQKFEVRQLAQDFNLPNKDRPDSQGLCFLGKVKFDEFLQAYLGKKPGLIIDAGTGDVMGRHCGVWYHTVGQRKGIGKVLDPQATSRGPWYVVAKDPKHDIVYCSNQYEEDAFTQARSEFYVEDIHWIAGKPPEQMLESNRVGRFHVKIRHGPKLVKASLHLVGDDCGNVVLDNKDGGLAPGQYVVFYTLDDLECLGGGVISERHWAKFLLDNRELAVPTET